MYVLTSLIVVASSLLVAWFFKRQRRIQKLLEKFPGPPIKFFFGSALDFMGDKGMLKVFKEYQENYGDIVFTRVGPTIHTLVFSDANFAKEIFRSNINLTKGQSYDHCEKWLGRGLLTTVEEKWKGQRKMLTPAFNTNLLTEFMGVFNNQANVLLKKLEGMVPTKSVNIYSLISLCSLDIICEASMGVDLKAQENHNSEYVTAIKEMCRIIAARSCSIMKQLTPYYIFTEDYRTEKKCVKLIHSYTDKVIKQKRIERQNRKEMELDKPQKSNLLEILLDYSDEQKLLSEKEIKDEVHTFMFAGHDTVTAAMSFFVYEIVKHKTIQDSLYEEQMVIFEGRETSSVEPDDVPKMRLLDFAIKESMRLYPPVPVYVRKVTKEFTFDGKLIPEGVTLLHFAYGLHRNEKYFKNADSFDPYRFENPESIAPGSYLPFSTGPRNCIGQKFAMYEMKVILSYLIRNFEFSPAVPEHQFQVRAEVVLTSKNGLNVGVTRRQMM